MKKILALFGLFIIGLTWFSSCEKDDICVEGGTPLLIIRFYDNAQQDTFKSVTSLKIIGEGATEPLANINRITTDSIAIPLKALATNTTFMLISNSADDTNGNETGNSDTLIFNYTTQEVFVSRACGYITNYNDLSQTLTDDGDNWIKNISIENTTIKTQNAAHVKIYH